MGLLIRPAEPRDEARIREVAAERARVQGAGAPEWESEPNAVGFYEKMGGRPVRQRLSSWGRLLTVMRSEL